jgi:hypothetical protein
MACYSAKFTLFNLGLFGQDVISFVGFCHDYVFMGAAVNFLPIIQLLPICLFYINVYIYLLDLGRVYFVAFMTFVLFHGVCC